MSIWLFLVNHANALWQHLFEHIYLSFSAILFAVIIGLPLGILSYQSKHLRHIILPLNNIFQTIPSLALLAFLIPFLGIGFKPTIVTLMIYALLPITRNTFTGLSQITEETHEACYSLGFTRWQRLRLIELPLAMPILIAGIRVATVMAIGITTIAAFIGAGGLGAFITEGLALNDSGLILLGAIPTALLALFVDALFAQFEIILVRPPIKQSFKKTRITLLSLVGILFLILCFYQLTQYLGSKKNTVTIGTKNFTESYILGNIMAELIQSETHLQVKLKSNLGSTAVLQNALISGSIDLYPEYTGTAYMVILHRTKMLSPKETWQIVKTEYKTEFNLIWLAPFGFSNSQTLAVTQHFADQNQLKTLSDLSAIAPTLSIAAPAAFINRPDSLPALSRAYNLKFKRIITMQPDLLYKAIENKTVDVIEVFTTDPRIKLYQLVPLADNKKIYPPYDAAPVARAEILKQYPEIKRALDKLNGRIHENDMRRMNSEVEFQHKTPKQVAHEFLSKSGFKV